MPTCKVMSNYRRYYIPGHSVFLTIGTYHRSNWLANDEYADLLVQSMRWAKTKYPFHHIAHVILPDHLQGKTNFSDLVGAVKRDMTWRLKDLGKSGPFWQNRFYDHIIRDDEDFGRHLDYVHCNPVRHGYVAQPMDYRWSSFQEWVKRGVYNETWGVMIPKCIKEMDLD